MIAPTISNELLAKLKFEYLTQKGRCRYGSVPSIKSDSGLVNVSSNINNRTL